MLTASLFYSALMQVVTHVSVVIALMPVIGGYMPHLALGVLENDPGTPRKNTIVFVGDILLARAVERTMDAYGAAYPFEQVQPYLEGSAVVANFEAAVPERHVPTQDFTTRFSVTRPHVAALYDAGISHVSLANNHSYDHGVDGFTSTKVALQEAGVVPMGDQRALDSSSIAYIDLPRGTVAVISINAVNWHATKDDLEHIFADAAQQSEHQIAYIHWGIEYERSHSPAQESLARDLIAHGADAIIGHHPHVVQDIAMYDSVPVFYSLGNFIFDQYFTSAVQQGLMVSVSIASDRTLAFTLIPVTSEQTPNAPAVMTDSKRDAFLHELARYSHFELRDGIRAGVLQLDNNSNSMSKPTYEHQ